jgi:glycosyltransferase involved in cell wall biosynthesis
MSRELTARDTHMDGQTQPLVSVVTPVYNGSKYLAECIESILAQTYPNWEYVIVDNCSTDSSLEIAQSYAQKDPRIRVHRNQTFVGMVENHNIALRLISPESVYCKVVHADDWLFPQCLADMVTLAETHPSVSIVGAYAIQGVRVVWDGLPYPSTVVPGHEVCRRSLPGGGFYVFGSPTSVLIRADCIRKHEAFYNGHRFHTQFMDQEVCYEVLRDTDFGFVHQVLTFSRLHDESSTTSTARTGLNIDLVAKLNILTRYGLIYLSKEEYERRFTKIMREYYRFLARNVFRWNRRQFWNYHKDALDYIGYPLSSLKLLKASLTEIIDTILSPKQIVTKMLGRVRNQPVV